MLLGIVLALPWHHGACNEKRQYVQEHIVRLFNAPAPEFPLIAGQPWRLRSRKFRLARSFSCCMYVASTCAIVRTFSELPCKIRHSRRDIQGSEIEPKTVAKSLVLLCFSGSGGGTRTPDTRIMMPGLCPENQQLESATPVKPASEDQKLSGILSNRSVAAVSAQAWRQFRTWRLHRSKGCASRV